MQHIHASAIKVVWECILKLKYSNLFSFPLQVEVTGRFSAEMWLVHMRTWCGAYDISSMMFLISLWFFFPDFSAPLTNTVREEKVDAQASMYTPNSTSGNAHPDASLSVLLATYSGERRHGLSAETSYDAQALWQETWTYRVWEILNEPGCKDILEVTTLCFKHGVLLLL